MAVPRMGYPTYPGNKQGWLSVLLTTSHLINHWTFLLENQNGHFFQDP
jgi:hypothetical protein